MTFKNVARYWLLYFSVLLTGCMGAAVAPLETPHIVATNAQTIKFRADITDENGIPLHDVTVQSEGRSLVPDMVWPYAVETKTSAPWTVDETLNYNKIGNYHVTIEYRKKGYAPARFGYENQSFSESPPPTNGGTPSGPYTLSPMASSVPVINTKDHPVTKVILRHLPAPIVSFEGPYAFLSNSWPVSITFDGIVYPTVEHAYQAAKTTDVAARRRIAALPSAEEAIEAGKAFSSNPNWLNLEFGIMYMFVHLKFANHRELVQLLIATGDTPLGEPNTSDDIPTGTSPAQERQLLCNVLMKIRQQYLIIDFRNKQRQEMRENAIKKASVPAQTAPANSQK